MSQKKNNGRRFAIDLGDDVDQLIDFGSEDDLDHVQNFSLADLLDRSDQRRAERSNLDDNDGIDFGSDEDFAPEEWALFLAQ